MVGIVIGVFFRNDPQPPTEPAQTNSSAGSSDTVDRPPESAANSSASEPGAEETADSRRLESRAATNTPRRDAGRSDREFRESDPAEDHQEHVYRDDTFGPDEPSLAFPQIVDEDGAADDFERYGDGPIVRSEADNLAADTRAASDRERELGDEGCLRAFSPCRQDSDCCGASVCRSRPGTISGHFECTPE
jgi:hypothetical protein